MVLRSQGATFKCCGLCKGRVDDIGCRCRIEQAELPQFVDLDVHVQRYSIKTNTTLSFYNKTRRYGPHREDGGPPPWHGNEIPPYALRVLPS